MKKVTRYLIYVLLITLALFCILALLFPLLLPKEKIKNLLTEELSRQLQRPVFIETLDIRLLPGPQLVARNIRIEDAAGFSAPPVLAADSLKVRVKLFPLLQKKVIMESFILEHPQVKLEKNSQGHWNWESWAPPKLNSRRDREPAGLAGGEDRERPEVSPVIFGFLSMKVRAGEMILRDEAQSSSPILKIQHINIDSRGRWRGQEGKFKFRAEGRIQEGVFRVKGGLLVPRGRRQPDIDLEYEFKNLNLSEISVVLKYFSWPHYLKAQGILSGKGQAQERMGKWEYTTDIKLTAGEAYWERPEGKLKLKGDASINFAESNKEGQKLSALLSLQEANWTYPWEGKNKEGKLQFKNVRGTVDYSPRHLEVNKAEFDFYGGKGRGAFEWRDEKPAGKMNLEMEIQEAKLEDLLISAFPSSSPAEGLMNLSLKARGEGNNWRDLKRTAQGEGDILINNFEVKGSSFQDPLGNIFMALVSGATTEKEKKPSTFKGKFYISDGRVVSDDINFSSLWFSAEAKGSYDLLDTNLNLKGQVKSGAKKIEFQLKGLLSKLHWNFKMGQVDLKFDSGKSKKKKKKSNDK